MKSLLGLCFGLLLIGGVAIAEDEGAKYMIADDGTAYERVVCYKEVATGQWYKTVNNTDNVVNLGYAESGQLQTIK